MSVAVSSYVNVLPTYLRLIIVANEISGVSCCRLLLIITGGKLSPKHALHSSTSTVYLYR